MNIADLVSRFEFYGIQLKDIKHNPAEKKRAFLLGDVTDIQVSVKEGIKFPCLFFQTPDFEKDGGYDNLSEHLEGSFVILDICPSGNTEAAKLATLDKCKKIADKVFNRILSDTGDFFDSADIKTSEGAFGPVVKDIYGWGVNFSISEAYNGEVDARDWEDLQ